VGEAYNAGETVPRIMAGYSIKLVTVLDHLYRFFCEGNAIRPDGLLNMSATTEEQRSAVLKTFDRLDPEYLGPVFEAYNGQVSYVDLKILRLYYLNKLS
jgi:ATP-dependent DNA helicase RecQ